ncbi:amino acid transporter [Suillus subaureus]|uniref:Amino acid transporter n=1 Tax=Suillus subaureus TaxID=48587 RepID=A0A9P7DW60_9AGAM|nr:amino acid transporter [Suillus subaureus]KAG1804416.1 amino acid transporter [Suillus subaureus]
MTSPSRPVNIGSPRQDNVFHSGTPTPIGTPDLRAWRAQYTGTPPVPNIPARFSPESFTSGSLGQNLLPQSEFLGRAYRLPPTGISPRPSSAITPGSGFDSSVLDLDTPPDDHKARVIKRHLLMREERQNRGDVNSTSGSLLDGRVFNDDTPSPGSSTPPPATSREETEVFPIPYEAPGADITHDIYKWHTDQRRQAGRPRASSFSGSVAPLNPAFEHIHEPGGFRRNYVLLHANGHGGEERRPTNNFIDFLYIYGQFAGEDLEEEEEDRADDEEATIRAGPSELEAHVVVDETQPLLKPRSTSRSKRRAASVGPHGDATVTQALLKAFVGTGILFLGKAFANGGLLFSVIMISVVALVSLYSFLLLVRTKFVVSGSFGDIGGALYGPWMRYLILFSIVVSQIGFVSAYTIFVAENLKAFVLAITKCETDWPVQYFILMQLVIFLPLALIRNLAKLSASALVADAFILAGLVYIFGSEMSFIGERGIAKVQMFNPKDFPLFVGTAVFSFEGIGLVIPITDAMREPRKFPKVLTGVMISLLFLFGGGGALSYLTFGSNVNTVVLVNLDQTSKLTQSVQFLYSLAILLSIPLQFFPAVRILENGLFVRSGKQDPRVKWLKNLFRFGLVAISTIISWVGAADLDKFVSLIGSFACVPLCFVYPAMLHYKAVAKTRTEKIGDILLGVFGMAAMMYTTALTIKLMAEPEPSVDLPSSC